MKRIDNILLLKENLTEVLRERLRNDFGVSAKIFGGTYPDERGDTCFMVSVHASVLDSEDAIRSALLDEAGKPYDRNKVTVRFIAHSHILAQ